MIFGPRQTRGAAAWTAQPPKASRPRQVRRRRASEAAARLGERLRAGSVTERQFGQNRVKEDRWPFGYMERWKRNGHSTFVYSMPFRPICSPADRHRSLEPPSHARSSPRRPRPPRPHYAFLHPHGSAHQARSRPPPGGAARPRAPLATPLLARTAALRHARPRPAGALPRATPALSNHSTARSCSTTAVAATRDHAGQRL